MIEFAQKYPERVWNETRLENHLKMKKRNFFFAVYASNLKYKESSVVGIENPFPEEKNMSKKFVNLEKWMKENKRFIKYTEFSMYRKPTGSHNSCIGGVYGLGTVCLSHFQLEEYSEEYSKIKPIFRLKDRKRQKNKIFEVFNRRISKHVTNINDQIVKEKNIDREALRKLYEDFFNELIKEMPEESLEQIFKHEVVIFDDKILGIKQEGKTQKNEDEESFEMPKYFNVQKVEKKPFVIYSRTRPNKQNLLISEDEQKRLHEFMTKILPDTGPLFILPLDEKLQNKMAENIAFNEKNFFKTVENLFGEYKEGKFDFYFVDIRNEKIQFFDYVSNYHYFFHDLFHDVFPLGRVKKQTPFEFNRKDLNEIFSKILGQKNNILCLPWVDPPKNMNTSKKSAYIHLREKMFETMYLGKTVLTETEIKNLCLVLIEDNIINEDRSKICDISNDCLNFFANSYLFILGGENMSMDNLITKAEKIEKQVINKEFKPTDKESGFYLLGMLLKKLCEKSETSNEKSRLLQPVINTHTFIGLNRVVVTKFVEKYAYKIEEKDEETAELMNKVLPFLAEQNGEESIKDFKLWLYAGFFSNNQKG